MDQFFATTQKLDSIIETLEGAISGDFPLPEPKQALEQLLLFFRDHQKDLMEIHKEYRDGAVDEEKFLSLCASITSWIYECGNIIGFLIRSTNVRNSFEWHWPLQRLSNVIFGDEKKKIIISAEWNFYPHTHLFAVKSAMLEHLTEFAFVGLPAYEARNPLIIPLAGHEIGHSLWATRGYDSFASAEVLPKLSAIYAGLSGQALPAHLRETATAHCVRQCQEMFCDFLGVCIFGLSYLQAFEYFVAPLRQKRVSYYPGVSQRASYIGWFYQRIRGRVEPNYADRFFEEPPLKTQADQVLLDAIDSTRSQMRRVIARLVIDAVRGRPVPLAKQSEVEKILRDFEKGRPTEDARGLPDIVAAGWVFYLKRQPISEDEFSKLSNLLLKSVEIWEFNERTK